MKNRGKACLAALACTVIAATGCHSTNDNSAARGATPTSTVSPTSSTYKAPAPTLPTTTTLAGPGQESPTSTTAISGLATLPIKGRAPLTGYSRGQFGPAWTDDVTVTGGHNGCDTRNDILHRDLTDVVVELGSNGC